MNEITSISGHMLDLKEPCRKCLVKDYCRVGSRKPVVNVVRGCGVVDTERYLQKVLYARLQMVGEKTESWGSVREA